MFFSYFISCGNINIHHIYIRNDYLCLNNKLNLYYCHRFRMKHFLHLNKLWTICHFMSIQTTNVTCNEDVLCVFLTWLCHLFGCHHGRFFLIYTCLHIVICHPTICAMFVSLPYIILCFFTTTCLILCGTESALLASVIVIPFSHNIAAFICCSVDRFILAIAILRYDCKPTLNTIVRKLFVVGIYKL